MTGYETASPGQVWSGERTGVVVLGSQRFGQAWNGPKGRYGAAICGQMLNALLWKGAARCGKARLAESGQN